MSESLLRDIDTFNRITGMYEDVNASLDKQRKQLQEEIEAPGELLHSMAARNLIGVLDGAGDVAFVELSIALLMTHYTGSVNVQGAINKVAKLSELPDYIVSMCLRQVNSSNLSKFDYSIIQANITVERYEASGIEVECRYDNESKLYVTYSTKNQVDKNGKEYHKGKVLKSAVNYVDPDFSDILHELAISGYEF